MANRYWVGGTGTWDSVTKTHWSATSGGAGGATVPTFSDDVIIDANSGTGTYTITNTGGSVDCKSFTISGLTTQSLTLTIQSGINCYGSWNTQGTQVTYTVPAGTVNINLSGTTSGLTFNPNGVSLPFNVNFGSGSSSYTLGSNLTLTKSASVCSITAGTLNIGSYTVSLARFSMSGSTTLVSSSATINCNGTGIASGTSLFSSTAATVSGALTIIYSSTASAGTIYVLTSPTTSCNVKATSGSYTFNLAGAMNNVDLTGFTGNWPISGSAYRIDGNLTLGTGMTTSFGASGSLTMYQGTSNAVITSNGVTINGPVYIGGGTSRIVQLADNLTINSSYVFTMYDCYFDINSKTFSCGQFVTGNNTLAKTIAFGASGSINITGYGNLSTTPSYMFYVIESAARLTLTGSKTVNFSYTGSNISYFQTNASTSSPTQASSFNINVTTGSYPLRWKASPIDNLNFTGFSGSLDFYSGGSNWVFGNITFSSTMTFVAIPSPIYLEASSGTQTITSNGVNMSGGAFVKSIDSTKTGSTVLLADNLNMTSTSACGITINAGTFDANNKNVTTAYLISTGVGGAVRTINMGSGTWSLYGGGTSIPLDFTLGGYNGNDYNSHQNDPSLTVNASATTVNLTNTTASQTMAFSTGGKSIYNLSLNGGSAASQIYQTFGNCVFTGTVSSNKTVAYTIQFETYTGYSPTYNYTFTCNNWSISGTSGNLVTLANQITASNFYFKIIKSGGGTITADYLSISRSTAEPSNTWYAGLNSVDGGINNGWIFSGNPSSARMLLMFF
ncbi:hypothetical protein EB001_17970 [bacterium]|nr:hypothetical protein [bacterium]